MLLTLKNGDPRRATDELKAVVREACQEQVSRQSAYDSARSQTVTALLDADEPAIAAVTVAEYRAGIELADTAARAADRARALTAITTRSTCSTTPKPQPPATPS